jgi:hypothetical protein
MVGHMKPQSDVGGKVGVEDRLPSGTCRSPRWPRSCVRCVTISAYFRGTQVDVVDEVHARQCP